MSNALFPTLAGLKFPVTRTPIWSNSIKVAASGKESRAGFWSSPRWKYKLSYDLLRSDANAEFQTLVGFFNARGGRFDDFLFNDPDDNTVTNQFVGNGNGVQTQFPLTRTLGGFVETITSPATVLIYINDTFSAYPLRSTPRTNFEPNANALNLWPKHPGVTVTANAASAPDGTTTADLVDFAGTSVGLGIFSIIGGTFTGITNTKSIWLRGVAGGEQVQLKDSSTGSGTLNITLTTSWQRYTITTSDQTTAGGPFIAKVSGNQFYAWGGQFETGPNATRNIATSGGAVTVTDFTIGTTGVVTLATPINAGFTATWSGTFYWRVRFNQDMLDFDKFMHQFWELGEVELITLK
jgi:uncharacterized protein (TIGR02217 family)